MFGTMAYLPTYFQMAEGVSATQAGLLMTPLMGSLLLASILVGRRVSRTGRYRLPPIVGSLLQIAFFISPVIWKPELIPHAKTWMRFNPFYSLLDVIREPLLDHAVPPVVWGLACVYSALLCLGAAANGLGNPRRVGVRFR